MKNMQKRKERRLAEKARKANKLAPGSEVEASDRVYRVDGNGCLRVLYYK